MPRPFALHVPGAVLALCLSLPLAAQGTAPAAAAARDSAPAPAAAPRPATPPATVTAGADGFGIRSADGAFSVRLRGGVQYDGRFFAEDTEEAAINTFAVRRARADLLGTLYSQYDFRLYMDFANSQVELLDAYLNARFSPAVQVRAGKFKVPMGLERLQTPWVVLFPERGFPTALVPNRDVGIQLHGVLGGGLLEYAAGVFNGTQDGGNQDVDASDSKDVVGRVFVQPFVKSAGPLRGLGLGVAASTGTQSGTLATPLLPTFRTSGREVFGRYRTDGTAPNTALADGRRTRIAPQGYWYAGPVGVLGEYTVSRQRIRRADDAEELENTAWQVEAAFALTGEAESFRGIAPAVPADPARGQWGAVELVARAHALELDEDAFPLYADPTRSMQAALAYGAGVNWYLNRNVRVLLAYERTDFDAASGTAERPAENSVIGRVQFAF
ncbi:OprO/OprP family phosphate-selective porin [Longimicrobium sp.]|uniref:OprO/OprP family phosphate-selective porin n=1 Tax=Longimicrobium sp. TaxID=2029185 RepID=UPI003B3B4723